MSRIRRSRLLAAVLASAGVLTGLAAVEASGGWAAAPGLTATFTRSSDWGTGFVANYTVTNGSSAAVNGWTLQFDLPTTTTLTDAWNGVMTRAGTHYTVRNESWNGTIAPGASVTVGFDGTYSGAKTDPTGCLVNGASCSGG